MFESHKIYVFENKLKLFNLNFRIKPKNMKKILIILIVSLLISQIAAQSRKCDCKLQYEVSNNMALYSPLEKLFQNSSAADNRDICDFRCTDWCSNEIRNSVNGDPNVITDLGN